MFYRNAYYTTVKHSDMVEMNIPVGLESAVIETLDDAGFNVQYVDGEYVVFDDNRTALDTVED